MSKASKKRNALRRKRSTNYFQMSEAQMILKSAEDRLTHANELLELAKAKNRMAIGKANVELNAQK